MKPREREIHTFGLADEVEEKEVAMVVATRCGAVESKDGGVAGGASRHYSASAIEWGLLGFVSGLVASANFVPHLSLL